MLGITRTRWRETSPDAITENPVMRLFWSMAFESVGQVTEQLLGAYSTDRRPSSAELIITYIGLHWLFIQCSQFANDTATQASCAAEAQSCREHADQVFAQLPFHLPANIDHVLALTMAVSVPMFPSTICLFRLGGAWLRDIYPPRADLMLIDPRNCRLNIA